LVEDEGRGRDEEEGSWKGRGRREAFCEEGGEEVLMVEDEGRRVNDEVGRGGRLGGR